MTVPVYSFPCSAILKGTATPTIGTVVANTTATFNVTVTGAATGDVAFANPETTNPGTNLVWTAWVSATNTVQVRVANPTAADVVSVNVTWAAVVVSF